LWILSTPRKKRTKEKLFYLNNFVLRMIIWRGIKVFFFNLRRYDRILSLGWELWSCLKSAKIRKNQNCYFTHIENEELAVYASLELFSFTFNDRIIYWKIIRICWYRWKQPNQHHIQYQQRLFVYCSIRHRFVATWNRKSCRV